MYIYDKNTKTTKSYNAWYAESENGLLPVHKVGRKEIDACGGAGSSVSAVREVLKTMCSEWHHTSLQFTKTHYAAKSDIYRAVAMVKNPEKFEFRKSRRSASSVNYPRQYQYTINYYKDPNNEWLMVFRDDAVKVVLESYKNYINTLRNKRVN